MNNETAYTVRTGADSTYFYVDITATPPAGTTPDQFANIYLGGPTFSGIVIEVTNDRFQNTGSGGPYYSLAGTGFTYSATVNDISFALPFSFLETDPDGAGFSLVHPGDLIRVSYSQSFGYSFDGGSTYYDPVNRLGAQIVPAAVAVTPEPGTLSLVGTGLMFCEFMRRRIARRNTKKIAIESAGGPASGAHSAPTFTAEACR